MSWRRMRYGLRFVDKTFYLAAGSSISRDLVAGKFGYIGPGCMLGPRVRLGHYVMLGPRVAIVGADHIFTQPGVPIIFAGRPELQQTTIENDAWIAHGCTLIAGITVGRGAIVAAGAVVTKDVPAYEIHGGIPARKIGERFSSLAEREVHDRMLQEPPKRRLFCPPI